MQQKHDVTFSERDLLREERLQGLSKYGKLRETGSHSYSAGEKSVGFYSDGRLMSCM
jgi:hypothetical protein